MAYAHCAASGSAEQRTRTAPGYHTYQCRSCRRRFHERTSTPFHHLHVPTAVMLLVGMQAPWDLSAVEQLLAWRDQKNRG